MQTLVCFVLAFATAIPLFANYPTSFQNSMVKVLDLAWELRNASSGVGQFSTDEIHEAQSALYRASKELSSIVLDGNLPAFSGLLKSMDSVARESFHITIKHLLASESELDPSDRSLDPGQFWPSPDDAPPGHILRLGKELQRQHLSTYWVVESGVETATVQASWKVEASLATKLAADLSAVILGAESTLNVDGKIVYVREVRFKEAVTLYIEKLVKWEHFEVWYELFIAKKPDQFGALPEWKPYGKTFRLENRRAGEAVVTDAKLVKVNS